MEPFEFLPAVYAIPFILIILFIHLLVIVLLIKFVARIFARAFLKEYLKLEKQRLNTEYKELSKKLTNK